MSHTVHVPRGGACVSMKSGLEGRNNASASQPGTVPARGLNEVRPRRPEQLSEGNTLRPASSSLNEVRPRRPEQSSKALSASSSGGEVSMKSGLEGRNNLLKVPQGLSFRESQ